MTNLNIRLPKKLKEDIKNKAKRLNISMGSYVKMVLSKSIS